MRKIAPILTLIAGAAWACGGADGTDMQQGAEVTIETADGSIVTGRVAQSPDQGESAAVGSLVEPVDGHSTAPPSALPRETVDSGGATDTGPTYDEVIVPAGTTLSVRLETALASNVSRVEDPVRGLLSDTVTIDGTPVLPEGSVVQGSVTGAEASGKVKGKANLSFRFDRLDIDDTRYDIRSELVRHEAEATKTDDAKKIGIGAGAGAVIGGLLGGKKGAGTGAIVGGGAGTAMVLTTAGDEVQLQAGTQIRVDLAQPLVILVPRG